MKILSLNTYGEGGGAARAAVRIHTALRQRGVESYLLAQKAPVALTSVVDGLKPLSGLWEARLRSHLDRLPMRLYPKRNGYIFSPNWLPDLILENALRLKPDLVHLHWIADGFVRIETLKSLNLPLLWTLHDSWGFTGGCHLPFECKRYLEKCGNCPALGSNRENDLSRSVWERKQKTFSSLNLTVVCPSQWLAKCARSSSLFSNCPIEVIPYGLDITSFKPFPKGEARAALKLPKDKKLIFFAAINALSDKNKGLHFLIDALRSLPEREAAEMDLVIAGDECPAHPLEINMRVHYLGMISDDKRLSLAYSAANLLAAPSIQENLPFSVMEALSCGTPSIAFHIGGIPDLIDHKRNGFLADPFDIRQLREGIRWVLEDETRQNSLSEEARKKVEREFSLVKIADRYYELYNKILHPRQKLML